MCTIRDLRLELSGIIVGAFLRANIGSPEPSSVVDISTSGTTAGIGCAAWDVVFRAGANALASITSRFKGHIPVFRKETSIVASENARWLAMW